MNLQVFLVHGFKSHSTFMSSFVEEYKNDDIHLKTDIHYHNWFAGVPTNNFEVGLSLLFGKQRYADKCHDDWNDALKNISESSHALSESINKCVGIGGDVLIVSHSLGSEVTRLAIEKIRSNINIYLFLMGGVSNDVDYYDLMERKNVHLGLNFYSKSDLILSDILPLMDGEFVTPIGRSRCYHDKISDININKGHSDYLKSRDVLFQYTSFVRYLVEKSAYSVFAMSSRF